MGSTTFIKPYFNWAFWEQVLYWGGGGGGVNLTPPSDLGPEGADRREILHGCQDTCKEYCQKKKLPKIVYSLYYYNLCTLDASYHIFINIFNK